MIEPLSDLNFTKYTPFLKWDVVRLELPDTEVSKTTSPDDEIIWTSPSNCLMTISFEKGLGERDTEGSSSSTFNVSPSIEIT